METHSTTTPEEPGAFEPGAGHAEPRARSMAGRRNARHPRRHSGAERLARGLGWFSIGLGVAQLAAPRAVARLIGIRDDERSQSTMRLMGLREVSSGVGLLRQPANASWAWTRVAGDAIDLALLGAAPKRKDGRRTSGAMAAVLGVTALDVLAAQRLGREGAPARRRAGRHVTHVLTVNRSPGECYRFWRRLENLPRFMAHLEEVRELDERRSHWVVKAPAGTRVEWGAEIIEDVPNERIAWRSLPGADIDNAGWVEFRPAPADRGTEVRLEMRYGAPGGKLGVLIAKLFGEEPGQQAKGDLFRFKQVLETGEVMHSDASIHPGMHPGQPPSDDELAEISLSGSYGDLQRREIR